MDHIADVFVDHKGMHSAGCRCGEWRVFGIASAEKVQQLFDQHKRNPFPAPGYRELVLRCRAAEIGLINEFGGSNRDNEKAWLDERCNAWLAAQGLPPMTPGELEHDEDVISE